MAIAGNPATWELAGEYGTHVLTGLVNQTFDDLAENIRRYRETLKAHGYDPRAKNVTVMLHTFVGEETNQIRSQVRAPLLHYLASHQSQFEGFADDLSTDDRQALLEFAFQNFFDRLGLLGSMGKCCGLVDRLVTLGVDEIACLVDFGVHREQVLQGLQYLNQLRERYADVGQSD